MNCTPLIGCQVYATVQIMAQAAAALPDKSAVEVQSVLDFVVKGGPVMIPIGVCSLAALTVIVERLVSLRRRNVIPPAFASTVTQHLAELPAGREKALEVCHACRAPIGRILAAAVKRLGEPIEQLERHIQEAGQREIGGLRKHLRLLSVIASVAPLLGLLGTITGMITAFQTVAASGEALGRTELLAKGIYEAMITTAAGLMVAIPTLVAYHWISARVDTLVSEMDGLTVEFVETHSPRVTRLSQDAASTPRMASELSMTDGGDGRAASPVQLVQAT